MARTLGLVETPTQSMLVRLSVFLRRKRLLLLLYNFEQVVAAAEGVAGKPAGCPRLKVMVMSRETLRLPCSLRALGSAEWLLTLDPPQHHLKYRGATFLGEAQPHQRGY
jgi:hypothetical protein